jgi:hypothetical protein
VVFYDAREDPLDQAAKVYCAVSRTGGESFEPNRPVADVPSNMTAANPYRYFGNYLEYIGVATHDCAAYVVWTDNRNQWPVYQGGLSHYYFDRVPFETNPPQITCPAPLEVECDGGNGGLLVTDPRAVAFFGGCQTTDDCAPECGITWRARQQGVMYNNPTKFEPGAYTVEFTAYDTAGNAATCDALLTVLDSSPPALDVTVTPDVLWPPDHRMVDVHASVLARDAVRRRGSLGAVVDRFGRARRRRGGRIHRAGYSKCLHGNKGRRFPSARGAERRGRWSNVSDRVPRD